MLKTALKILKKIEDEGYKAYIVGGFVRDYLLGIESLDVDIATNATPKEIMKMFDNIVLPNEEYGAVTLYIKNYRFEITTFRREIRYINNRKPVEIEYIDDLLEDLQRRDFRMNTMCMDKDENVIDLLGGRKDIETKTINIVGNSDYKFKQDSLRMLRAIRFATILNFNLSSDIKEAIIRNKEFINNLSYSRKKQELDKIFSSKNSKYGIKLLLELGLSQELELYGLEKVNPDGDLISIWASLDLKDRYPFTKNERDIINSVRKVINHQIDNLSLYKYGLYVNQVAADIMGIERFLITEMYEKLPITSRKEINITSEDIMIIINQKEGPIFKTIYDDLEQKILEGKLVNSKDKITDYIISTYL